MSKTSVWFACLVVLSGIAGVVSAVEPLDLKVDIGALDARDPNNVITQPVKAGWTEWSELREDPGAPFVTKSFGNITVSLSQTGGDGLGFRNGLGGDLTGDMVGVDNQTEFCTITMTIGGLVPGNYVMTTWHNYIFDTAGLLDIKVDGVRKVKDLAVTMAAATDETAATATYQFHASGGDVVIEFISTQMSANVPLNGFHLQRSSVSVGFETASSGGVEAISPAAVAVNLSEIQAGTATVEYAVVGGTATRNVDYMLEDGTLTFNPGQTSKNININVVGDGTTEPDETIILELSNPNPGMDMDITRHTYTISDRIPEVGFAAATSSGLETETGAAVVVNLSHAGDKAITVHYAVTGGTATRGSDYNLAGDTLQFAPGVVSRSIDIDALDDETREGDETVFLTLSNTTNATLASANVHTFTIIDNEMGVLFDGLTWFHSDSLLRLNVNEAGQLQWDTEKSDQLTVRLPEQRFSQVGDVVTFSYIWSSSGRVEPGCECYEDRNPDPDIYEFCSDVTCVGGTGDFRLGLFDSNGRGYINSHLTGSKEPVFQGYLGYHFRFFPHVPQDAPARFSEPKDDGGSESHTNTSIWERSNPEANSSLLSNSNSWNRLDDPMKGGLGIPAGGSALLTVRLERVAEDEAKLSLSCNGKTWTKHSESSDVIPDKIDVFAIYLNSREYDYVTFGIPESSRSSAPRPADGARGVSMNTPLGWRVGSSAVSNDVYFGTDFDAVNSADTGSVQYKGNQTGSYGNFGPGGLELDMTYYWRVDDITPTETLKGDVWSFSTTECDVIEDFESYDDANDFAAGWQYAGGALLELSTEEHHQGAKSMELQYYNREGYNYSEAVYSFAESQNWKNNHALGLYFKGRPSNQADRMYVSVEDATGNTAAVAYSGGSNALKSIDWQQWKTELEQFSGVDLRNVKMLRVGIGDTGAGGSSGASGILYVDDIGLCGGGGAVAGCQCPGDLNPSPAGNGQIDLDDLQAVAGILLDAGSPFIVNVQADHCGDLNQDGQVDLDDLQAVARILLDGGSPFIVQCE